MDIHVRAAVPAGRLRPAGAGPEVVLVAGAMLAMIRAVRRRSIRPLAGGPVAVAAALLSERRPRPPFLISVAGDALRLLFGLGALTEALRRGRPILAIRALHPIDPSAAKQRAWRRTSRTASALVACTLFVRARG